MSPLLVLLAVIGFVVVALAGVVGFHVVTGLLRLAHGEPAPGLWRAAAKEVIAFLRIASWTLTGGARLQPEDLKGDEDVVVVLVHGAMADGSCTTGWARGLKKAGVNAPIVAPDHGVVVRALEVHTARVRNFVQRLRLAAPSAKLIFVAHSMGGLVVRRLLADDDDVRDATVGVVTVASPHAGTASVRVVPFGLAHLGAGYKGFSTLPPLSTLVKTSYVVGSAVDAIVYPKSTTLPAGSTEAVSFDDVGHAGFLVDDAVAERVAGFVRLMIAGVRSVSS